MAYLAMDIIHQQGTSVSRDMIYTLLNGCSKQKNLSAGRHVYSLMVNIGLDSITFLGDHLIRLFALCGSLLEADVTFGKISQPTVYTWNAIISANAMHGDGVRAIELYNKMQDKGYQPNIFTFLSMLKACVITRAIGQGRRLHEQIIRCGLEADLTVGSTLIDMYAKCGRLREGHKLFDELHCRNAVPWNAIIAGCAQNGSGDLAFELFEKMQEEGIRPNEVTFSCVLKGCGSIQAIEKGRSIHNLLIQNELESSTVIGSTLVDMYCKCGSLEEGQRVFNKLPYQNVVTWNAMMAGCVRHKNAYLVFEHFGKMQQEGIKPDKVTFSCILKACGGTGAIERGRLLHDQTLRHGFESDVVVGNTLIDMYAKCASLEEGCKVFDVLPYRNVVSWSAMIAGYAQQGKDHTALDFFEKMQQEGIKPHKVLYSCILNVCGSIGAVAQGRMLHDQILRQEFGLDLVVQNTLIDMYVKFGSLDEGLKVFDDLPDRDVVSWNAMIAGYGQHENNPLFALELFQKMQQENIHPTKVTFSCVLKACGSIGAIEQGRLVNDQILLSGMELDVVLGNTLVDMYAKCGCLEEAWKMFRESPNQNEVSWNALIAMYSHQGNLRLASQLFDDMQRKGLKPNDRTYSSILATCTHAGKLDEGHGYLMSMRDHGVVPSSEHFNCMVGLLGCAGRLDEAKELLQTMPASADAPFWRSLLASCQRHGNLELGRQCSNEAVQLMPDSGAGYVLMSNIYSDSQMWEDVQKLQELRKCAGAWKKPGRSWIEVDTKVHEFVVGDKTHQHSAKIHTKLNRIHKLLKERGYVPQVGLVLETMPQ